MNARRCTCHDRKRSLTGSIRSTTTYLYDGTNVLQQQVYQGGTATVMLGLRLDEHLGRTSSTGTTRYFLTDAQGSTIALTDSSGVIQTQYQYGPFGQTTSSGQTSDNPYQYTGHEFEAITISGYATDRFYNFRARYLDTVTGRFASSDPEGFAGGSRNLYSYANSNPLNMLDPTGKFSWGGVDVADTNAAIRAGLGGPGQAFGPGGSGTGTQAAGGDAAQAGNAGDSGSGGAGNSVPQTSSGWKQGVGVVDAASTALSIEMGAEMGFEVGGLIGGPLGAGLGVLGGMVVGAGVGIVESNIMASYGY